MSKPIILSYKTLKKSGEPNDKYAKAVENSGGVLQMLETDAEIDEWIGKADGVLLPGGVDVNPMLYSEERKSHTQPPHNERDRFEMYLVEKAMERKLPILGICRGLQVLNVKFGGTLYQDVEKEMPHAIRHDWHEENQEPISRSTLAHDVSIKQDSKLGTLVGSDIVKVNSLHHQGIKDLGIGLVATGHSSDNLVEALEKPDYPYLVAVQWHPEELYSDIVWKKLWDDFVKVCSK